MEKNLSIRYNLYIEFNRRCEMGNKIANKKDSFHVSMKS
ncbi:hypothetical protein S3E15_05405 [Bacillus mycoides]|uniref:Uncharacterized protein n=1 Tax=Bacillus mycoides TaxID=1405 RepID=A0AAP7W7N0_BACMY|nr:hypothetical protein S3E15_05405 [Bacillus mycoides]